MQPIFLWSLWQQLLQAFAGVVMPRCFARFVAWITGLALNVEEHTVTQSLVGLDLPEHWKRLHNFIEYGHWNQPVLEDILAEVLEDAPGRIWHGYRISALDDSKAHRSSKEVWGTCTFHEPNARCPNRARTVRAHNWVVLGALLHNPDQPAHFLPQTGRLYFRKSQLPQQPDQEIFHTKCELGVEMLQKQAEAVPGQHLAVFDGAFAVRTVVRPLVRPPEGLPRVAFITRLRHNARLYELPPTERPKGQRGPRPKWGRRLPPPRQGGWWSGPWQEGKVFLYGRVRTVRWKEVVCLWSVMGAETPVKAVVAEVEGFTKRFYLVSSAIELSGLQIMELFGARFRQEDGFRDLKQRLGWEECRAWTKQPVLRTAWAQMLTLSLLRLLQLRLEACGETDWWYRPPWNKHKNRPSILDVERLLRQHRQEFQQEVSRGLGSLGQPEEEKEELAAAS